MKIYEMEKKRIRIKYQEEMNDDFVNPDVRKFNSQLEE